jgi:anti-sigma regulatory factor (Ser/Thr protein kinase)
MPDPPTRSMRRPPAAWIALPRSPASVAAARRFIEARAAAWSFPELASQQLVLIGSELVTNAVLHARTELTLTLELREDRVRISVKDRSKAPATLRHYRPDALTGRGLGVVAALSDTWGVSAAADGKVVWAELGANGDDPAAAPRPPDLRNAPSTPSTSAPGARPVRFVGVPVDGYLELQAHNDALFRELELISIELEHDVAAAKDRGDATVELRTTATPAAASAAGGYLALLEQADALCRDGTLLTPEPPAGVKSLRRWFVEQMAAQVEGAAPTPPG